MKMPERLRSVSLHLGAGALLLGLVGAGSAAEPRAADSNRAGAVALAFDRASGTLLKATAQALYRSADGGRSWSRLALPPSAKGGGIGSVAVSAGDKGVLYVAGPGLGVLRSDDGGRSWAGRNKGLPSKEVVALAAHADQPDTLYAYLAGRGVFRSEDGGGNWQLMDGGPRSSIERLIHSNMPGSMQTGWFFAATAKGVSRAMDCFCGWRDAGALGRTVKAVAYDPRQPQHVYAATNDGLVLSMDGGEQWARVNAPAGGINALIVTPSGVLYAGAGEGVLYRSSDQAKTWERVDA